MTVRGGRPALTADEVEQRREAILSAVLEQISERGTAGVRMKDVARAAGMSIGTIQYYFDSREALVLAAYRRHSENVVSRVKSPFPGEGDPWEGLRRTLHEFLHVADFTMRTRLWIEFVAASARDDQLLELLDSVFLTWKQVVREVVDAGVADGTFSPRVDPEVAVDALLAQLDGFEIAHAIGSRGTDVERIELVLQQTARALLGVEPSHPE
ncbi:TetR/AcrR family transcriptional regulator [Brevibacterium album]|uniref:TetR/AcrR family transcriptional regulator n=1 Tax=Brevibacterium album TaxID=417948 RepID=UPI0004232132|nr:TetR/AcrR family transcriptional regulator [Brevibacterium album]